MRGFHCHCGQVLYFDNSLCHACGSTVAYDPGTGHMFSLSPVADGWQSRQDGRNYRLCANRTEYAVCNAVVDLAEDAALCLSCRLNRTIPDLSREGNLLRWAKLEQAKRRLIFGLLSLGLPLQAPVAGYPCGLCFDFLQDQRTDPNGATSYVATGHRHGVITLNILEADDVQRVWQREQSSERYRTLLGHFRHEAGHYYHELLAGDVTGFSRLFGDGSQNYDVALQHYYTWGPAADWQNSHISAYASAHPLEDWAESFAHYLHMRDTLETGLLYGVVPADRLAPGIDGLLSQWDELAVILNELNRSLGLQDAYPFVVNSLVAEKLRYVHQRIVDVAANRWPG
jgi:hypothetical protein